MKQASQGFALMTVLFMSALLSALALGYATTARFKALQVQNARERVQKGFRLEAAIELGWFEYQKYLANQSLMANREEVEAITEAPLALWYPRQEPYTAVIDGEEYSIQLINESAKMGLSSLGYDDLVTILGLCGAPEDTAQIVADSILDYVDSDEFHRLNGAENQYYYSLDIPYECKDSAVESMEELLLVKDVTPELYFGGEGHPGLVDLLTIEGNSKTMDINSASRESFSVVEGLPDEVVDEIIAMRQEQPIQDMAELADIVPYEFFDVLKQYFSVTGIEYLTIVAWPKEAGPEIGPRRQKTFSLVSGTSS